ncbi:MAG: hypothetical protein JSR33_11185 [Proteobacteria bacterium]|nr:hypothetical protein [Pseudomonadota bacterium]
MKKLAVGVWMLGSITKGFGTDIENYQAPGNLISENDLECVGSEKLSNKYTPADLYKASAKCIDQNDYEKAAFLFALAGVYGRFDTYRVADQTAHQAVTVLRMETFGSLDEDKSVAFKKALLNSFHNPKKQTMLCKQIVLIGSPNYYPTYMIQHGMGAFEQKTNSDIVANFDAQAAWKKSLDTYLHCPK